MITSLRSVFAALALITIVNLRGVRESGLTFGIPTYAFVVLFLAILLIGGGR